MFWKLFAWILAISTALGAAAEFVPARIERAGAQSTFVAESSEVSDLSGLTWAGGDRFYAVSDKANVIVPVQLEIDRNTGEITRGRIEDVIAVKARGADFEAVVFVRHTKRLFVAAERGNAVFGFGMDGDLERTPSVPAVFRRARKNLGLESLAWDDATRTFWTANEEALTPDGPVAGNSTGSLVRLQRMDASFRPLAQYAWRTEPAAMRYGQAGSGVTDLVALPGGGLLVLERGFSLGLHCRVFHADFTRATDTSKRSALEDARIQPAEKRLLFQSATGVINYEGATLGPELRDGSRSLILVADSNGRNSHVFMALRVYPKRP